jgi:hypothetical protein
MRPAHTPGPWVIGSQVTGDGFNLWSESTNDVVAWVAPLRNSVDEESGCREVDPADMHQHPDARLIAAAPDMLEALHRADAALSLLCAMGTADRHDRSALDQIRAAIAKATGGDQ